MQIAVLVLFVGVFLGGMSGLCYAAIEHDRGDYGPRHSWGLWILRETLAVTTGYVMSLIIVAVDMYVLLKILLELPVIMLTLYLVYISHRASLNMTVKFGKRMVAVLPSPRQYEDGLSGSRQTLNNLGYFNYELTSVRYLFFREKLLCTFRKTSHPWEYSNTYGVSPDILHVPKSEAMNLRRKKGWVPVNFLPDAWRRDWYCNIYCKRAIDCP